MKEDRPDILLITTDQQRFDTIRALGSEFAITPNLDRLAEDSTVFRNGYSVLPSCIPARASIVTGCYSATHRLPVNYFENEEQIPHDVPVFPEILSNGDYDTIAIGKMHFSPVRRHNGFNRMYLMEEIPRYRENDEYLMYLKDQGYGNVQSPHGVRHFLYMRPQESFIPTRLHGSTWVTDRTIEEIDLHNDRSYMIWTSFIEPHPPLDVPPEWAHLYDDVEIPAPIRDNTPIGNLAIDNAQIMEEGTTEESIDRFKRLYYASISFVDHQIGRIIDHLKETGRYDNTLIVFCSDHGEMLGDHGTYQKFQPYEGASHIPFMVKFPRGIESSVGEDELVSILDLAPTFVECAGLKMPDDGRLAGESLVCRNRRLDRSILFLEHGLGVYRWVSARTDKWKYNYFYSEGREELFDMVNDRNETTNLLYEPDSESLETRNELRRKAIQWEKTWGHSEYVEDDDFIKLPSYGPVGYIERNFPIFPSHLPETERRKMLSLKEEMELAVADEPTENIHDFDLGLLPDGSGND